MRYVIVGHGRMGRVVDEHALARGHTRLAIFDLPDGGEELRGDRLGDAEIAFEFTEPNAAAANVSALLEAGTSVVCGTTGWEATPALLERAAAGPAALMVAPNFSLGLNLFLRMARFAAASVGSLGLHEPFVEEAHHRGKLDAPSGTARKLAALVVEADPRLDGVFEGQPSGRLPAGMLQVVSTRAGAEPGTHRLGFDGEHDRIILEHRARGREGFALGAVLAAEWLRGKRGVRSFDELLDAILRGELRAEGGGR